MSELKRVGAIEVEQDLEFQRGEWRLQRVGRFVLALIALIALLGGLGNGLLARAEVSSSNRDLLVKYDRIARHHADTRILITLPNHSDSAVIWLSADYLEGVELKHLTPQPVRMRSTDQRIEFTFNVLPGARIEIVVAPDRRWARQVQLGSVGGPTLRFTQFILP